MSEGSKKNKKYIKLIAGFIALFFVFALGYGLGSGNITFARTAANSSAPANLNYASVEKIYDLLRKNYDGKLEEPKLLDGLKKGLVEATGDPYTEYLTAEETQQFNSDLNGTFSGIGAELGKDGDNIVIVAPISGFPAEKAGIKSKDIVAEVDGESTAGKTVSEIVDKIRGPEGSEVKLSLIRNGQPTEVTIKRANITIPSVDSKMLANNTGYIRISRFGDDTASLTRDAASKLKSQGAKAMILDVRGNPGGLLDAAVDVSSLWLPNNKVVLQEKRNDVVVKTYNSNGNTVLEGMPTVVMIDGGSASASEIVSGALKDNNAAKLLGAKSYGKGSVQTVEKLPDGSSLKVTIARWYTPGGRNIDKEGIEPDVKVEQKNGSTSDLQLDAAINELKK